MVLLNLPVGQLRHTAWPSVAMYFPIGHSSQVSFPKLGCTLPRSHTSHKLVLSGMPLYPGALQCGENEQKTAINERGKRTMIVRTNQGHTVGLVG